eukprot:767239-Hanusia_phi.AAC.5
MKIAKKRELYLERKHPSKGLAEATKKRKSRRKTFFGLMDRITLRGDWDGEWRRRGDKESKKGMRRDEQKMRRTK